MSEPDLSVELCGVRLSNPLVLAAGILGTGAELLARVAESGAGMVTTKSHDIDGWLLIVFGPICSGYYLGYSAISN